MSKLVVDGKLVDQGTSDVVYLDESLAHQVVERESHVALVGVGENVNVA